MLSDEDISQKFTRLKNDIMQFVRLFLSMTEKGTTSAESEDGLAEELQELSIRAFVARQLHHDFFGNDIVSRIFGTPAASEKGFEQQLRESGCAGMLIWALQLDIVPRDTKLTMDALITQSL